MSDTAYYENQYEEAPPAGRWRSVVSGVAAAALSLSMLGAVVAWAYQISVRDAHDVPVIRAIEGPMKQRPEKSGGLKLEEKDLAVTRMVSGEGTSGAATLAPAGEQPAPEDKPVAAIRRAAEAGAPTLKLQPSATADEGVVVASAPSPGPEKPAGATPEPAVGSSTGTPVAPMDSAAPATGSSTGTPVAALADPTAVTERAPDQSPPVRTRPKTLDTSVAASTTNTPVAREEVVLGKPVIQLGAFGSRQMAERAWKDQKVINRSLFRGMEATITPVQSGGRELYRLRVGPFPSENEAKKVCIVVKARGADCIFTWQE